MAIAIGSTLGNYKIVSRIGNGGMGAVYLAEHPVIGKRVAIKVIHKELAMNQDVIARFFQEARAVASIGHQNIVDVHDFSQSPEGDYYYVMEYLQGVTLASAISTKHQMPLSRIARIVSQIGSALGAAHQRGVIHRDLKPDNVMLIERAGRADYVKLLDFGLAKFFASSSAAGNGLTAVGSVVGTPQYMSPEACQSNKVVDHRTDIYALGVLLYQMIAGRLPFPTGDAGTLLRKQVFEMPPPIREFAPDIPPELEKVVQRAMEKDPARRFQSMQQLVEAMATFVTERMESQRPSLGDISPIPGARGVSQSSSGGETRPKSPSLASGLSEERPVQKRLLSSLGMAGLFVGLMLVGGAAVFYYLSDQAQKSVQVLGPAKPAYTVVVRGDEGLPQALAPVPFAEPVDPQSPRLAKMPTGERKLGAKGGELWLVALTPQLPPAEPAPTIEPEPAAPGKNSAQ